MLQNNVGIKEHSSAPFTRSVTEPLRNCFFCQKDDGHDLFTVRTENAGKALRQAVEISQNQVLMTRLNNAISPVDAHAIDVRYHKVCWTQHVFHVLRDDACNQVKSPQTLLPMQILCLIELINLVDVHTQNKAYLPMDVVETSYISMLGGRDAAQKHTPTLMRQWLKDKILSELPTVKSVRQNDSIHSEGVCWLCRTACPYLHLVKVILLFVEASRNADIALHLEAGEALSKLFFAFDRIKYKRLWARYIADMHELKIKHPATWKELEDGNISVTKNEIPFVSIGPDHACEHLNRVMKVHSGLVGISNSANARQQFFLASPEMSCLSTEFKGQFELQMNKPEGHHDL